MSTEKAFSFKRFFQSKNNIKQGKVKLFRFFLLFLLYVLSILGIVFSGLNLAKEKQNKTGLFNDSYLISYKLGVANNEQEATAQLKTAAEKFADYLFARNVSVNNVFYETKTESGTINGYINVEYLDPGKFNFSEENQEINLTPDTVGFRNLNSASLSVWLFNPSSSSNTTGNTANGNTLPRYQDSALIRFSDFEYSRIRADERLDTGINNNGFVVDLKQTRDFEQIGEIFKQQKEANGENQNTTDLQLVVIRDIDTLVNRLNYSKFVSLNYQRNVVDAATTGASIDQQRRWSVIYNSFRSQFPQYITWSDEAIDKRSANNFSGTDVVTQDKLIQYYEIAAKNDTFNTTFGGKNVSESLKTIVDPFILGTINKNNTRNYFALNSEEEINFKEINAISLQQPTTINPVEWNNLFNEFRNDHLGVEFAQPNANARINENSYTPVVIGNSLRSYFQENKYTKINTYNSIFLASGVILLLIAIIVSVLYRTIGLIISFSVIAGFVFVFGLFNLLNINISVGSILAIFASLFIALTSLFTVVERIRKLLIQKNSVFDSLQLGIKKSLLSIVDLNVGALIFGIILFLVGKNQIKDFGIVLLLGGVIMLGTIYVLSVIPVYLISFEKGFWKTTLLMSFAQKENKLKVQFSEKYWSISWFVLIGISVIALILFLAIGQTSPSILNQGQAIYITYNNPVTTTVAMNQNLQVLTPEQISLIQATLKGFFDFRAGENAVLAYTNSHFNLSEIQTLLNEINSGLSGLNVSQLTFASSFNDSIFTSGIIGLFAAIGVVNIYYAIRLSFLNAVGLFVVNIFVLAINLALTYLFQFPIDQWHIYAIIFTAVINNSIGCVFISVSKTRLDKRTIFEKPQIIEFIVINLKSLLNLMIINWFINFSSITLLAFLVSDQLLLLFIKILFINIYSGFVTYLLIAHLFLYVLLVRQKYVKNIFARLDSKMKEEMGEVDEESVFSINKFH